MDSLVSLFTTTEGRISRKSWWLGLVILIVINIAALFLILPLVGLSAMPNQQALTEAAADPARLGALLTGAVQAGGWGSLIMLVITGFPMYALYVKRRHDRNNNGLDALIFIGVMAVTYLVQALGFGFALGELPGVGQVPMPTLLMNVLNGVMFVFGIYMLVVMGFLKGTPGPNDYGPDPLGATAPATA